MRAASEQCVLSRELVSMTHQSVCLESVSEHRGRTSVLLVESVSEQCVCDCSTRRPTCTESDSEQGRCSLRDNLELARSEKEEQARESVLLARSCLIETGEGRHSSLLALDETTNKNKCSLACLITRSQHKGRRSLTRSEKEEEQVLLLALR